MGKNLKARAIVIVVVVVACIIGIVGFPKSGADLQRNWQNNIRLGLDLKGGSHLVLQVQVQDAVKAEADQVMERLKEDLKKQNVSWASIDRNDPQRVEDADSVEITIKGIPATQTSAFRTLINEKYTDWVLTAQNSTDYSLRMKPSELVALKRDTVEREIQTISNRINQLGLTEPSVQQYGRAGDQYQILVQLPGVDDPARVKELIGTTAVLEIDEVKEGPFASREAAMSQHGGILPLNTKLAKMLPRGGSEGDQWYLLAKSPVITGRDMRNARPGQDEFRKWETNFTLSQDGGKRFGTFTEKNVGNRLAVVLDNSIVSVATIQSRIEDSGRITGLGSEEESVDLSRYLRSGSLPAGINYLEERSVGPSLGADSIHEGFLAGIFGLLAVVIVMLVYYKRAGINAVLALLLNTVVLLAAISYFHAVLTLPGIAGIILTIGMAVDSNVLIFERIREELRAGKAVVAAVDAGFGKAWWTIVDTHVTTMVSCAFLFLFGEGPVRGFAVTLVIGLAANVFTAVFVSRTIFIWELQGRRQMQELSI
ncbi:MAG TPA: protein translocase subunit SecD [Bryobacteraceae bacterium]|jgi:preprotein translocase subunit SecD|nr:protein translocase subunit SecD [Bryobacteraceae bacterium]